MRRPSAPRLRSALVALAAVAATLLVPMVVLPAPAAAVSKVTLCHRTAADGNPYRRISVRQSAVQGRGHGTHTGHDYPRSPWTDVIPGVLGWTAQGQAVFDGTVRTPSGRVACRAQSALEFYRAMSAELTSTGARRFSDDEIVAELNEMKANEDAALLAELGGTFTVANLSRLGAVSATTDPVGAVTHTTAELRGSISSGTTAAAARFAVSTDPDMINGLTTVEAAQATTTGTRTISATATGLLPGRQYHVRALGVTDPGGEGEGTLEGQMRSFTTPALPVQTVVLDAGPDAVWGAADRVVQVPPATPTGTLPTLASTTPLVCTVAGAAVTVLTTGTCTLVATAAATGSHPAASATDSFAVMRAPQSVTVPSLAVWHDDWGTFDYRPRASSLLPVTLTAGPGCSATGTVVTVAPGPGQCRLEASQPGDDRFLPAATVVRTVDVRAADTTPAPLDRVLEAKAPQAVLFAQPEDVLVTSRSRTLSATATSGLPVTWSAGPAARCTVDGHGEVALHAVGACTVTASAPGDATFEPASTSRSFEVRKAAQTVALTAPRAALVPDGAFAVTATAVGPVTLSALSADCAVSGSTVTPLRSGSCLLVATAGETPTHLPAAAEHAVLLSRGTPVLTLTAPAVTAPDGLPFAVTPAGRSDGAVTLASGDTSVCTVDRLTVTPHRVGTCVLTATQEATAAWDGATARATVEVLPPAAADPPAPDVPGPTVPVPTVPTVPVPTVPTVPVPTVPVPTVPAPAVPVPGPALAPGPAPAPAVRPLPPAVLRDVPRRGLVPVPATLPGEGSAVRQTTNTARSAAGRLAPASTTIGRGALRSGQATTLSGRYLFAFDSPVLTPRGQQIVRALVPNLRGARAITCEGYTDYAGDARHELQLSQRRSVAVCRALRAYGAKVTTRTVGYGGRKPVVLGGLARERHENRRVVVVVDR